MKVGLHSRLLFALMVAFLSTMAGAKASKLNLVISDDQKAILLHLNDDLFLPLVDINYSDACDLGLEVKYPMAENDRHWIYHRNKEIRETVPALDDYARKKGGPKSSFDYDDYGHLLTDIRNSTSNRQREIEIEGIEFSIVPIKQSYLKSEFSSVLIDHWMEEESIKRWLRMKSTFMECEKAIKQFPQERKPIVIRQAGQTEVVDLSDLTSLGLRFEPSTIDDVTLGFNLDSNELQITPHAGTEETEWLVTLNPYHPEFDDLEFPEIELSLNLDKGAGANGEQEENRTKLFAVVVVGLVVIATAVVLFVYLRRRRRKGGTSIDDSQLTTHRTDTPQTMITPTETPKSVTKLTETFTPRPTYDNVSNSKALNDRSLNGFTEQEVLKHLLEQSRRRTDAVALSRHARQALEEIWCDLEGEHYPPQTQVPAKQLRDLLTDLRVFASEIAKQSSVSDTGRSLTEQRDAQILGHGKRKSVLDWVTKELSESRSSKSGLSELQGNIHLALGYLEGSLSPLKRDIFDLFQDTKAFLAGEGHLPLQRQDDTIKRLTKKGIYVSSLAKTTFTIYKRAQVIARQLGEELQQGTETDLLERLQELRTYLESGIDKSALEEAGIFGNESDGNGKNKVVDYLLSGPLAGNLRLALGAAAKLQWQLRSRALMADSRQDAAAKARYMRVDLLCSAVLHALHTIGLLAGQLYHDFYPGAPYEENLMQYGTEAKILSVEEIEKLTAVLGNGLIEHSEVGVSRVEEDRLKTLSKSRVLRASDQKLNRGQS